MSASAEPIALRAHGVADAEPYRAFRLTALCEAPSAFTSRGFEVRGQEPRAVLVDGRAVAKPHLVRLPAAGTR
ncbi:hypothetical protein [Streptomyces sp. CBMA123]|uniref:hypothetical protein n=1 Tax=Streptomyces sp. CBMA123 TaxID=1896313 RepID=UPI001661F1D0|nr:hypothetical protein [Streptomyces sp. CBMA123]MBD0689830.1 hypothetical protein [Streptomyces sp. CBMA123]